MCKPVPLWESRQVTVHGRLPDKSAFALVMPYSLPQPSLPRVLCTHSVLHMHCRYRYSLCQPESLECSSSHILQSNCIPQWPYLPTSSHVLKRVVNTHSPSPWDIVGSWCIRVWKKSLPLNSPTTHTSHTHSHKIITPSLILVPIIIMLVAIGIIIIISAPFPSG